MRTLAAVFALLVTPISIYTPATFAQTQTPVKLEVDLRDATRRIYHSKMEFPVKPGPFTLVYPKWIPGEHSPNGPIVDVTGVHFRANGQEIPWRRDDVDLYLFHCTIPAGITAMEATLDYLLPKEDGTAGSPSATAQVAVLPWNLVVLYPQGAKTDEVMFSASIRVPAGWKFATALTTVRSDGPEAAAFETISLTRLVDSPLLAGAFFKTYDLSPGQKPEHRLNIAADSAIATKLTADELAHLRQLVAETGTLFGARHYRHYDFMLALTDHLPVNGLEHHESSDNRGPEKMLLDPDSLEGLMDLLPHEFFHSWNGKYRRPAGLATPDYQEPMKGDLLWVYEGLTQYYGVMLAARSGFWKPEQLREYLAATFAALNDGRPGRSWRDLEDTAISVSILYGARQAGASWRRPVDYYEESELIWLEADTIIRRETKGQKSLDDFCRKFHGTEDGAIKVAPYTFDDVVAALNAIAPYGWKDFFEKRLHSHGPGAPLGGLENSGWKLSYNDEMNDHQRAAEQTDGNVDLSFSLGFTAQAAGDDVNSIVDVLPDSPAAKAGIAPGMKLVAVNGRKWTPDWLRVAIREAKNAKEPIRLLLENDEFYQTFEIDYHGGERYPHLESLHTTDVLSEIAKHRAPAVAK
jgi:predicted metalloprotease with PDZ domain